MAKRKSLKKVMSDPDARELLGRVGENLPLDDARDDMRSFVLSFIYGEGTSASCQEARASKWQKLKKKNTIRLPPDNDTLDQHLKRTNYLSYCQQNFNLDEHPSPIGHGWELVNGKCCPVRYTLSPLPQQLPLHDHDYSDLSSEDEESEWGDSTDSDSDG